MLKTTACGFGSLALAGLCQQVQAGVPYTLVQRHPMFPPRAKRVIFLFMAGGPSHVDTWDMKPNAPVEYRGPYKTIPTKVPGMRLNEMHTELAKLTDQFTLINSMTHPGGISNHFDAMHNLLSGQSVKRVRQGVPDDQPYLGSFVAKHKPRTRNIVSNAWLIKCVGPSVFCSPNLALGG